VNTNLKWIKPLNLTPGQVREIIGLSQDTFQHWRKTLSPLQSKNGYTACFTPGDLVAISVVHAVCEGAGVRVGALKEMAPSLFELCNSSAWTTLERSRFVFDMSRKSLHLSLESKIEMSDILLMVACGPIVTSLRSHLLTESIEPQGYLKFPPSLVTKRKRIAGARER
jgi:hypothetical protein